MLVTLAVIYNLLFAYLWWQSRRTIKQTRAAMARLQRFLDETHTAWSVDQTRWEERMRELRDRMAVVDVEGRTVYVGPQGMTEDDLWGQWRVTRLARWEDMPIYE